MHRLFRSFSQVDASTTRKYGGTGLGLMISKRFAEMMGGSMWVESVVNKGSTFHFTLVAAIADRAETGAEIGPVELLRGKRVLIVDDNATNRLLLTHETTAFGMDPCAVASPIDALRLISSDEPFDIAILDMLMPEMDGLDLGREIRALRPAADLPMLMLSSVGAPQVASQTSDTPVADLFGAVLTKPIKAAQLRNALLRALSFDAPMPAQRTRHTFDRTLAERAPLRILLAEDNRVNQLVALRMLERMGYRADVAGNGIEALAALDRQRYDLVLMDVQMPEMDGLAASRAICERWTRCSRPRIVAMTANASNDDREACLAAGMDDFLPKPVSVQDLADILERCSTKLRHAAQTLQQVSQA
jgi:CheY-like chemotaxis protein